MRPARLTLLTLAIAAVATTAFAGNGNAPGNGKRGKPIHMTAPGLAHCPPGLAKKSPACVPPGQAKKYRYRVGERINNGYVILGDPWRYDLDPNQTYYRVGDYLYRVDRDTREVIDFLGAAAALLD